MTRRATSLGQVLVLFVLFLLVLLGVAAIGIDYASWLLVDRNLQNTSDHAALAGASQFQDRTSATNCAGTKCFDARSQAWRSLSDELDLGLTDAAIVALAANDSPAGGQPSGVYGGQTVTFKDNIWVATPPPAYAAYVGAGGRYSQNHGVVFVRVDRAVRSFLGGALGIQPGPRTGWATAGALPTDFALQVFCRNHISPQSGVCENSAGLTIDGQGGITLLKGDVGSNESLTVTANGGAGVVVQDGNVFLVNRSCHASTWNCPNGPPSLGGISDGTNGKNAFYIAPLPVPRYESPTDFAPHSTCGTATASSPCIPYRNQYAPETPTFAQWTGDWTCGDGITACGTPNVSGSTISCTAGAYDPSSRILRPNLDETDSRWTGTPNNSDLFENVNDAAVDPTGSLPGSSPGSAPLGGTPTDYVYSDAGWSVTYRVALRPPQGIPDGTNMTVRYVLFKTNGATVASGGHAVDVTTRLVRKNGASFNLVPGGSDGPRAASDTITVYQYDVAMTGLTTSDYNNLYLEFVVATTRSTGAGAVNNRGAGISWAEVEIPSLLPANPPTVNPGYWHSIVIPDNSCAILDPSPSVGLEQFQLPGVFRFGGGGTGSNTPRIVLGTNSYLIGDAVSLVLDPRVGSGGSATGFPDNGIDIRTGSAMVINTGTTTYNPSYPAVANPLPANAINAAWRVDSSDTTNPRNGENSWPVCLTGGNDCVPEACYMNLDPTASGCVGLSVSGLDFGRGTSFYLTPDWADPDIQRRFYMSGAGQSDAPGIAFEGVLYAPYDDVKISGRNNFNTVGQVLSWTAKFHGGSASILLDYPYDYTPAAPYLLEPTVDH